MSAPGCLVLALCGLPGAGKTTLARYLLDELPLREVNRDVIRQAQFPLCAFSGEEKGAAVEAVRAAVVANCRLGFSSLIDGMTFATAAERGDFARLAHQENARFLVLYLDCPVALAKSRLADDKTHLAADRRPELVDKVAARFEPPGEEAIRLNAELRMERVYRLARSVIQGLLRSELQ